MNRNSTQHSWSRRRSGICLSVPPSSVPGPENRHAEPGLLQAEVRLPSRILRAALYLVSTQRLGSQSDGGLDGRGPARGAGTRATSIWRRFLKRGSGSSSGSDRCLRRQVLSWGSDFLARGSGWCLHQQTFGWSRGFLVDHCGKLNEKSEIGLNWLSYEINMVENAYCKMNERAWECNPVLFPRRYTCGYRSYIEVPGLSTTQFLSQWGALGRYGWPLPPGLSG